MWFISSNSLQEITMAPKINLFIFTNSEYRTSLVITTLFFTKREHNGFTLLSWCNTYSHWESKTEGDVAIGSASIITARKVILASVSHSVHRKVGVGITGPRFLPHEGWWVCQVMDPFRGGGSGYVFGVDMSRGWVCTGEVIPVPHTDT